jgi:hypothetical protein
LRKQWSNDPEYLEEYEKLSTEFELARVLIKTRTNAGLTQEDTQYSILVGVKVVPSSLIFLI